MIDIRNLDITNSSPHKSDYLLCSMGLPIVGDVPVKGRHKNECRLPSEFFYGMAKEILQKKNSFSFVAGGTSMYPFIRHGDTVIVQPAISLETGNVVLAKNQQRLILHRIIKITADGVITRGDACLCDDGFTPFEDVLGKAAKSSGPGFHLSFPFNKLIASGLIHPSNLSRHRVLLSLARKLAYFFRLKLRLSSRHMDTYFAGLKRKR